MNYPQLIAVLLAGGDEKKLELRFVSRCQSARLPCPRGQVRAVPGRLFAWDFGWRAASGRWVLVEIQGGVWSRGKMGHNSGGGIARDAEKSNVGQLAGHLCLVFTEAQIDDGSAVALVRQALAMEAIAA